MSKSWRVRVVYISLPVSASCSWPPASVFLQNFTSSLEYFLGQHLLNFKKKTKKHMFSEITLLLCLTVILNWLQSNFQQVTLCVILSLLALFFPCVSTVSAFWKLLFMFLCCVCPDNDYLSLVTGVSPLACLCTLSLCIALHRLPISVDIYLHLVFLYQWQFLGSGLCVLFHKGLSKGTLTQNTASWLALGICLVRLADNLS